MGHLIKAVDQDGIAYEMGIRPGDTLLQVNGEEIGDIFDYQFQIENEEITVLILKEDGEEWELEIEKDLDMDLGMEFENGLMDNYRSCSNKCIFCFIDQMPKGMRETLYFKDDDSRLSFLQGNYVTLTNMSDVDIDRIIEYRMEPVNISFQTTNPVLRCKMLNNRFSGEALKKVDRLFKAGIEMNGQIVLCKGINDGDELIRTIKDLTQYIPYLRSVSVVPVGLSKHRDGLYPLEPLNGEDAKKVLSIVHEWQDKLYPEYGTHFIHAADEFYILAERDLPDEDTYDGYLQYENGVGMIRSFLDEFHEAMEGLKGKLATGEKAPLSIEREISIADGLIMKPFMEGMVREMRKACPKLIIHYYPIINHFFGESITVSGLLTGHDIVNELRGRELGSVLYLPGNLLKSDSDLLLDDMRIRDLEEALQVKIDCLESNGYAFLEAIVGLE